MIIILYLEYNSHLALQSCNEKIWSQDLPLDKFRYFGIPTIRVSSSKNTIIKKKETIVYPINKVEIKLNNNIFILYKIPKKIDIL